MANPFRSIRLEEAISSPCGPNQGGLLILFSIETKPIIVETWDSLRKELFWQILSDPLGWMKPSRVHVVQTRVDCCFFSIETKPIMVETKDSRRKEPI